MMRLRISGTVGVVSDFALYQFSPLLAVVVAPTFFDVIPFEWYIR